MVMTLACVAGILTDAVDSTIAMVVWLLKTGLLLVMVKE